MSFINVDFYSNSLRRVVPFSVIMPNDINQDWIVDNEHFKRPMKTLFLLHGYAGNQFAWVHGGPIVDFANRYNVAVVLPAGENGFFVDGQGVGSAYSTYIGEELVEYVGKTFNISTKYEDMFIAGLSMGGFGAIYNGLKHNNTFSKVAGLSSALIIHNIKGMKEGTVDHIADYGYYARVFGDLDNVVESDKNPETLVKNIIINKERMPEILMACGTEDFLLEQNREFDKFLVENNVEHLYYESKGVHDFVFWNEYIEISLKWFLGVK